MNILTTITDGDTILRLTGTFGASKTVSINSFGGQTYIHLKSPDKDGGWKQFTMSVKEYTNLSRMLDGQQLQVISKNFDLQYRNHLKAEEEARKRAIIEEDEDVVIMENTPAQEDEDEDRPRRKKRRMEGRRYIDEEATESSQN